MLLFISTFSPFTVRLQVTLKQKAKLSFTDGENIAILVFLKTIGPSSGLEEYRNGILRIKSSV